MQKIFLITIIILTSFSCRAQDNSLNSKELTINNKTIYGKDKSILISNFGQPLKIEKDFSEMDNVDMFFYKYNGVNFTVKKDKVTNFSITSNKFNFTKNNIKIGNNINTLKLIYPNSYSSKINNGITILLDDMDMFIIISYDNNDIIQKIALYSS